MPGRGRGQKRSASSARKTASKAPRTVDLSDTEEDTSGGCGGECLQCTMPQEFQVLQCFSCHTFQVHPVKKSPKWCCKLCGEKQSLRKVYGQGTGADCRHHVQRLNSIRGDHESVIQLNIAPSDNGHGYMSADCEYESNHDKTEGFHCDPQGLSSSRWEQYLHTDSQTEADANGDEERTVDDDACFTTERRVFNDATKTSKLQTRKTAKADTETSRWGQYSDQRSEPSIQLNQAVKKRKFGMQFERAKSPDYTPNYTKHMPNDIKPVPNCTPTYDKHISNYPDASYEYPKSDMADSLSGGDSQDSVDTSSEAGGVYITMDEYRGVIDKENNGACGLLETHESVTNTSTPASRASSKWDQFTPAQKPSAAGNHRCLGNRDNDFEVTEHGVAESDVSQNVIAHNAKSDVSEMQCKWNKYVAGTVEINLKDAKQDIACQKIFKPFHANTSKMNKQSCKQVTLSEDVHKPSRNSPTLQLQSKATLKVVGSVFDVLKAKQTVTAKVFPGIFCSGELDDEDLQT